MKIERFKCFCTFYQASQNTANVLPHRPSLQMRGSSEARHRTCISITSSNWSKYRVEAEVEAGASQACGFQRMPAPSYTIHAVEVAASCRVYFIVLRARHFSDLHHVVLRFFCPLFVKFEYVTQCMTSRPNSITHPNLAVDRSAKDARCPSKASALIIHLSQAYC